MTNDIRWNNKVKKGCRLEKMHYNAAENETKKKTTMNKREKNSCK